MRTTTSRMPRESKQPAFQEALVKTDVPHSFRKSPPFVPFLRSPEIWSHKRVRICAAEKLACRVVQRAFRVEMQERRNRSGRKAKKNKK